MACGTFILTVPQDSLFSRCHMHFRTMTTLLFPPLNPFSSHTTAQQEPVGASPSSINPSLLDYVLDVNAALSRQLTPSKRKQAVPRLQQRQAWLKRQGRPAEAASEHDGTPARAPRAARGGGTSLANALAAGETLTKGKKKKLAKR